MTEPTPVNNMTAWQRSFQIFTAIIGGYFFANAASILTTNLLPFPLPEAVAWGFIISFVYYALAIIWVFAHASLTKGCGLLWLLTGVLAGLSWLFNALGAAN